MSDSVSYAKFHCNRLTTVQDVQDYASLTFLAHSVLRHKSLITSTLSTTFLLIDWMSPISHSDICAHLIRELVMVREGLLLLLVLFY